MQDQEIIKTVCTHCGKKYKVPALIVGKEIPCKNCNKKFSIKDYSLAKKYPLIMTIALKYKLISENKIIEILEDYESYQKEGNEISLDKYIVSKQIFSDECLKLLTSATENIELKKMSKLFGTIAIKMNLVTKQDIYDSLMIQANESQEDNKRRYLGQILVEQGKITEKQCDLVLTAIKHNVDQKAARKEASQSGTKEETPEPVKKEKDEVEEPLEVPEEKSPVEPEKSDPKDLYGPIPELPHSHRDVTGNKLGFHYTITHDGMGVYLTYVEVHKRDSDMDSESEEKTETKILSLDDIRDMLLDLGVVSGIVEDALIQDYLDNHLKTREIFRIASGSAPIPGKATKIINHFASDHLKSGSMHSQGKIDFRDRGKIPIVEEGFLLAEKIPGYPPENGKDVYGNIIHADTVQDEKIICGTGVTLSEDGLKVFAAEKGQPKTSLSGKLSVMSELKIPGNVDYKTGHIDFEGNVIVKGIIRNGFRVNGDNVTAENVVGAKVIATGNVTITGGIIDSTITATGDVKAKFIHKSTLSAYGDVNIDKEIIDTTIENSGECIAKTGKIISSTIASKKGIIAKDIGTEMSAPCKFMIGVDSHKDKEIEAIMERINTHKEKHTELTAPKEKLEKEENDISLLITKLAHIQDRSQIEIKTTKEKLEEVSKKQAPADLIKKLEEHITLLEEKAKEADANINLNFDRQDEIVKELSDLSSPIKALDDIIEELEHEIKGINDWAKNEASKSVLEVIGLMQEGTVIHGKHTVITMKEKKRSVKVKEIRESEPPHDWKLHVF